MAVAEKEEKSVKDERWESLLALGKNINKDAGGLPVVQTAADIMKNAAMFPRWPTGIFGFDYALGGGIPAGRISMLWGEKSTGKTTTALRVVSRVQKSCSSCFHLLKDCKCAKPQPGTCLWVDTEGTWDKHMEAWAKMLGIDFNRLLISRPFKAEHAVDVVTNAMETGAADLIVIDSLAQFTPGAEIEKSAEDGAMGVGARIINRGFRVWTSKQNELVAKYGSATTLLVINQIRFKPTPYGDPRTPPGGHGQEFAVSTWTMLKRVGGKDNDLLDKETGELIAATFGYQVTKNKTATAGGDGEYMLIFQDTARRKKGTVVEDGLIIELAKRVGLIEGEKKLKLDGKEYASQQELEDFWIANPDKFESFKRKLMGKLLE